MEAKKYALGVRWVKEVLYGVQFTKERLLVVANKMINDVSRYGPAMYSGTCIQVS